jgi:predicted RecA/RadA family phage recombinase
VAIAGGDIVVLTDIIGIAIADIEPGGEGTLQLKDCIARIPKTVAEVWAQGQQLYYDPGTGFVTNVAGALSRCGVSAYDIGAGAVTGFLLLNHNS